MSLVESTLTRLRREAELEHSVHWLKFFFKLKTPISTIHVKSLLVDNGQLFIYKVYKMLLKRPVDLDGLSYYSKALKTGKLNKLEIILTIMNSPEGKENSPNISGLSWRKALNSIFRSKS